MSKKKTFKNLIIKPLVLLLQKTQIINNSTLIFMCIFHENLIGCQENLSQKGN